MLIVRESVNINKNKPNRCTCCKCRNIISPPLYICESCWKKFTFFPLINYKQQTQQNISQFKQKAQLKILNQQPQRIKQYMLHEYQKSINTSLIQKIQKSRNKLSKLESSKVFLQQTISKKERVLINMQQLYKYFESSYFSLQFNISNLIQNSKKWKQKLKSIKFSIVKQFQILNTCSIEHIGYQIQNMITTKRTQLDLIEQDNQKTIFIDRFYLKNQDEKSIKVIFYMLSIVLWQVYLVRQIMQIMLPYQINITQKDGEITIGSKTIVNNINNVQKKSSIEQILGMVYVDIKYILSLKWKNITKEQKFSITTKELKELVQQQFSKKEMTQYKIKNEQKIKTYIFQSKIDMISLDRQKILKIQKQQQRKKKIDNFQERTMNGKFKVFHQQILDNNY